MWKLLVVWGFVFLEGATSNELEIGHFSSKGGLNYEADIDSSSELLKRYGGSSYPIQHGHAILNGPAPTLGVLVLGAFFGGAVAVFQAAEARANLQSQADNVRNQLNTARTNFNSLTTSITTLSSSLVSAAPRASAACLAIATAAEAPTGTTNAAIIASLTAVIEAFGASSCPP